MRVGTRRDRDRAALRLRRAWQRPDAVVDKLNLLQPRSVSGHRTSAGACAPRRDRARRFRGWDRMEVNSTASTRDARGDIATAARSACRSTVLRRRRFDGGANACALVSRIGGTRRRSHIRAAKRRWSPCRGRCFTSACHHPVRRHTVSTFMRLCARHVEGNAQVTILPGHPRERASADGIERELDHIGVRVAVLDETGSPPHQGELTIRARSESVSTRDGTPDGARRRCAPRNRLGEDDETARRGCAPPTSPRRRSPSRST